MIEAEIPCQDEWQTYKGVAYILGRKFSGNCLADLTQRVTICELESGMLLKGENGSLRRVKESSFVLEVLKLSAV